MNTIYVNGRLETVNDYYDGIEVVRNDVGEDWYNFMHQELVNADEEYCRLDREVGEYRQNEQVIIGEYHDYLIDVEDLIDTALAKIGEMRSTTKLREVEKILAEARKICFENT